MNIEVDKEWWQHIFDEIYLLTDARSVCDEQLTSREVDYIVGFLRPKKSAKILDLCGGHGRHAIELGRRGTADPFCSARRRPVRRWLGPPGMRRVSM